MLVMQAGDSLMGGLPVIHITYQQYLANPSAYQDPSVLVHISGFPTGHMPADYVGYDSSLDMEDIGNIATKAIAKVEPSDTALYLHEVGTGFINKDGNYCITDVQIAVGGSIVLGTNCHVVDGGISNNLSSILNPENIEVTITNGDTYGSVLTKLKALIDYSKLTNHSVLCFANTNKIAHLNSYSLSDVGFSLSGTDSSGTAIRYFYISTSNVFCYSAIGSTRTDATNTAVPSAYVGMKATIYYR